MVQISFSNVIYTYRVLGISTSSQIPSLDEVFLNDCYSFIFLKQVIWFLINLQVWTDKTIMFMDNKESVAWRLCCVVNTRISSLSPTEGGNLFKSSSYFLRSTQNFIDIFHFKTSNVYERRMWCSLNQWICKKNTALYFTFLALDVNSYFLL